MESSVLLALISMAGTIATAAFGAYGVIRSATLEQPSVSPGTALWGVGGASRTSRRELRKLFAITLGLVVVTSVVVYLVAERAEDKGIQPQRVPDGYKAYSWAEGGIGIAIPESHEVGLQTRQITFINAKDEIVSITSAPADPVDLVKIEANPERSFEFLAADFEVNLPTVRMTGKVEQRTHQGRPAYKVAAESGGAKGAIYLVLDKQERRLLVLVVFTEPQQVETVFATLNLGATPGVALPANR